MASLGQDLKKERELRGISLKEIADTTKINLRFLRALEEDQITMLPGEFFIRGILRAYAEYLGLDENDILNRYFHEKQMTVQEGEGPGQEKEDRAGLPQKAKNVLAFSGLVVVLTALLLTLYFMNRKDQPPRVEEHIQTTALPARKAQVAEEIQSQMEVFQTLMIEMTFQADTWIKIIADRNIVFEGTKMPGAQFRTEAREELIINCGNLGGFTYSINGKKGKPLGRSGEIAANIRINLDNWKQFIEESDRPAAQQ